MNTTQLPPPNLHNIIPRNKDLLFIQTCFHRAGLLENHSQFLECPLARLDKEEVNNDHFERVPADKQEVVLPPGARECDSRHKRVVEGGNINKKLSRDSRLAQYTPKIK